jgi:hypothetical protein
MLEPLDPREWTEFFLSVAAAAAVLTGLIVVGLSIHAEFIARSLTHRSHARATLVVLTAAMVIGLVVISPQSSQWLGWELVLISLGVASINTYNNARAMRRAGWHLPRDAWVRIGIGYAIAACGVIGGISIAVLDGQGGGLYWIAVETIAALVWAIAGAWRFLIGVTDEKRADLP